MLKTYFYCAPAAIESDEDVPSSSRPFKPTSVYTLEPEVVALTSVEQRVDKKTVTSVLMISIVQLFYIGCRYCKKRMCVDVRGEMWCDRHDCI